jgi:hypothetical protein
MYAHPWKRFGHDRLYVTIDGETPIGYWDRKTDELHPVAPKHAETLAAFIAEWKQEHDVAADEAEDVLESAGADHVRPVSEDDAQPSGADAYSGWELGYLGELFVDAELTRLKDLDPRWHHRDSIVIGPAGVFTINAKHHHGGTLWVGGDETMVNQRWVAHVDNARSGAAHARDVLTQATGLRPTVQGVVVVVSAERLTVKQAPEDVLILQLSDLVEHLLALPEVLSGEEIEQLVAVAAQQEAWDQVTA